MIQRTRSAIKENSKHELQLELTCEFTSAPMEDVTAQDTEVLWTENVDATVAAFKYFQAQVQKLG
jgi:hypothetical protein